jgi:hypothetical protein
VTRPLQLREQLAQQQMQLDEAEQRHKLFVQRARQACCSNSFRVRALTTSQRRTCRCDG